MNLQKLYALNDQNPAAQIYFATFATRRRSPTQNSVQELVDLARRQRITLAPSDVEAFFEELGAAKCGQFVRDEYGPRFMWLLKAVEVARAARQKHDPMAALAPEDHAPALISHSLRLRADWTLTLELPPDFSPEEAKRVGYFLLALPLKTEQAITETK